MKEQQQINLQVSLNPDNKSHMDLLKWINVETTNRSSFIRETLFMRMVGFIGSMGNNGAAVSLEDNDISMEEALSIIQV
jgi:hypothetical protein